MWKVRYMDGGELIEVHFDGTLAEVAASFGAMDVRVVQYAGRAGTVDQAKGESAVSVEKT